MFNKLFALMGHITPFTTVINDIETLVANFMTNEGTDMSSKDAAIDAVIEIIQAHKSTAITPVVTPITPVPSAQ